MKTCYNSYARVEYWYSTGTVRYCFGWTTSLRNREQNWQMASTKSSKICLKLFTRFKNLRSLQRFSHYRYLMTQSDTLMTIYIMDGRLLVLIRHCTIVPLLTIVCSSDKYFFRLEFRWGNEIAKKISTFLQ